MVADADGEGGGRGEEFPGVLDLGVAGVECAM